MIVGSTTSVLSIITNSIAFTVVSSAGLLTMPDGTTTVITPVIDSTVAAFSHTANSLVPMPQVGKYIYKLTSLLSDGQTKVSITEQFASYIDLDDIVRDRLQLDSSIIPDIVIYRGLRTTCDMLTARYVPVYFSSYATIPSIDVQNFDTALAILTSAMMRGFLPKTTPTGDFISNKIGPDEFTYANLAAYTSKPLAPIETRWLIEAQVLLDNLSFMQKDLTTDSTMPLFVPSGPRRTARAYLSISKDQPDYNIWGDVNTRYLWSRNFVTASM